MSPEKKLLTEGELRDRLLEFALSLPEAWEDHPWGESVAKVRKKVFVFLGVAHDDPVKPVSMSVKLPESADHALSLPGAAPTGYGLGRAGWVTVPLRSGSPGLDVLADWVEESYRTVAPKTLAAKLTGDRPQLAG